MKIFHLFANHKFTGPSDPAMVLATAQAAVGAEIGFISSTHPQAENVLDQSARARGLRTFHGLRMPKHFHLSSLRSDVRKLRKLIAQEKPDFIHSHLDGDHLVCALARTQDGPLLIRSTYDLDPPRGLRAAWIARHTDLWIAPTQQAAERLASSKKRSREKIRIIPPLLDLERFKSTSHAEPSKPSASTMKDKIVIGVVARMQKHRRFPELIDSFAAAARIDPRLHLEILGRGSRQVQLAQNPARDSGFGDRIHFPGYIEPSSYPLHLAGFDMVVFLVPGSDGTCRAAREAMACGVPVIASRRGLLPELIPTTGGYLLEDERDETLTRAILTLAGDENLRRNLADGAEKYSREVFDVKLHARALLDDLDHSLASI